MASSDSTQSGKNQVLVVLQLNGGNDFMNTVIPHDDPLYYDYRGTVGIPEDDVLRIDDRYGFHPAMGPLKELWDQRKVAIVAGVGYPNPVRSHFRSMDIWHTSEPDKVATEGWLGRAVRELDSRSENPPYGGKFWHRTPQGAGRARGGCLFGGPARDARTSHRY